MPKILIAEDDKNLSKVLKINLESEGFETAVAYDGEETLTKIREVTPDLLLLDIMMPKLDGFQVARAMKADPLFASIPIIVLTAKGSEEDLMKGWEMGAVDYFVKPFNLTRLIDAVAKQLNVTDQERVSGGSVKYIPPAGSINVALVGAEEAGISLLKFLLGNHRINILGVADRNEQAEGLRLAQQMGLFVTTNIADVLNLEQLSLVLATKNASVLQLLHRDDSIEVLGETSINFLQTIVGENEEREHRERLLTQKLNVCIQKEKSRITGVLELIGVMVDTVSANPGHICRVREIARGLGAAMHLPQSEQEDLDLTASIYDVGKLFLTKEQIKEFNSLPYESRYERDTHASIGGEYLNKISILHSLAHIVRAHHERWDGEGLPDRLTGGAIPIESRILALSDHCATLLGQGKGHSDVLAAIKEHSGTLYDPNLVALLPELLKNRTAIGDPT